MKRHKPRGTTHQSRYRTFVNELNDLNSRGKPTEDKAKHEDKDRSELNKGADYSTRKLIDFLDFLVEVSSLRVPGFVSTAMSCRIPTQHLHADFVSALCVASSMELGIRDPVMRPPGPNMSHRRQLMRTCSFWVVFADTYHVSLVHNSTDFTLEI